jgi:hypothetical protein
MTKFNNGKPYHGSDAVMQGKLQVSTAETDYFYFFCPKCPDKHVLRILDYGVHEEEVDHPYNDQVTKKAKRAFTLAFHLYCEHCKFTDFVKISNTGWQGRTYAEIMSPFTA